MNNDRDIGGKCKKNMSLKASNDLKAEGTNADIKASAQIK